MSMRKWVSLMALAGIASTVLAGCGGSGDSSDSGGKASGSPSASSPASGESAAPSGGGSSGKAVEITFWGDWSGEGQ